jgi:hypothetical protein
MMKREFGGGGGFVATLDMIRSLSLCVNTVAYLIAGVWFAVLARTVDPLLSSVEDGLGS